MLDRAVIIERFIWGMSILCSFIHFNSRLNLQSANIFAENFMRDLLNILFSYELCHVPKENTRGYDLICKKTKTIIQVTSDNTPQKINKTFHTMSSYPQTAKTTSNSKSVQDNLQDDLWPDLTDYRIIFCILAEDTSKLKSYRGSQSKGYCPPPFLDFDVEKDIIDLPYLIKSVNDLDNYGLEAINKFMDVNPILFTDRTSQSSSRYRIHEIINEYADNYTSPLFHHVYSQNRKITLQNLYVDPVFIEHGAQNDPSRDTVSLFSSFLWQNSECRMLYIDGDAAIGKTSLISWLCYHYNHRGASENNKSIGKAIFGNEKLVCIRLRELDLSEKKDAHEYILSYLGISSLPEFLKDYSHAAIVLDGIDEISMIDNHVTPSFLKDFICNIRRSFKYNKLIITGRPYFLDIDEITSFKIKHISLMHFTTDMREQWIEKLEKTGEIIQDGTKNYILNLTPTTAEGVADTPLALYLLASCNIRNELQGNRWALYHEIFKNAILDTEYNEHFHAGTIAHPINVNKEILYSVVCRIAAKMFENSSSQQFFISNVDLNNVIQKIDINSLSSEQIRHCCVLCAYWKSNCTAGALEFYHNDIRDFFFCEYIYDLIEKQLVSNTFSYGNFIPLLCEIFQYGYVSGTTWEQSFEFLYLRCTYEISKTQKALFHNLYQWIEKISFSQVVSMLLNSIELFSFSYSDMRYTSIKRIIFDTLLLFHVFYEALIDARSLKIKIKLKDTDTALAVLSNSGVFRDWVEMFSHVAKISSTKRIGIGTNTDFSNIDLSRTTMSFPVFDHSHFDTANFYNSNLIHSSFVSSLLYDVDFSNSSLIEANFHAATLHNVNFDGTDLSRSIFDYAIIQNCNLSHFNFSNCSFKHTKFVSCNLSNATFSDANLYNTVFDSCNLKEADYRRTRTHQRVQYIKCTLIGARYESALLIDTDFGFSDLSRAQFYKAQLDNTILQNAKLEDTNFSYADLHASNIHGIRWGTAQIDHTNFPHAL